MTLLADGLRACHCNINSLRAHVESLRFFLSSHPTFHVIAATETKLAPSIPDDLVSLDGYVLLRGDRNVHGGGVALYVHDSLRVKVLHKSSDIYIGKPGRPEFIFCEVSGAHCSPIFVAVVYRPPHAPFIHGSEFVPQLVAHMQGYSHKIILGDFNADQLTDSDDSKFVRQLMADNSLKLAQHGATHHTGTSDTWLDLCMVDESDVIVDSWKTEVPFVDGHDLIAATLRIHVNDSPKKYTFQYRDYKNMDSSGLLKYLSGQDWSTFDGLPVDGKVQFLSAHLTEAIDVFAPMKIVTGDRHRCPWYTPELKYLVRERDYLYRVYRRSRGDQALLAYRTARDLAHCRIRESRMLFHSDRLSGLTDPRLLWKELRNLGLVATSKEPRHGFSADVLNDHFSGVSLDPSAPPLETSISDMSGTESEHKFCFREITLQEVHESVEYFKTQAKGSDGIPQLVVSKALPVVAPFILNIFNSSLKEGVFPVRWKEAVIVALSKTCSPNTPSDFRPIALLCFMAKALERLVRLQIEEFITAENLINEYQAGFRAGQGTQTALLKLTDDIRIGIDRKMVTILLLFDFSKAFDSVCHLKLLHKLRDLGFSPGVLRWVASYLSGRRQAVLGADGVISSWRFTNRGVPQGSVLGPLLFILFINDISSILVNCKHLVYADDLQIYLHCSPHDLDRGIAAMRANVESVYGWSVSNSLSLNVGKTKAMIVGGSRFVNGIDVSSLPLITCNGESVPFVDAARSLGVVIDNKLNWKQQINQVIKQVNGILYRLRFFRSATSLELRVKLVKTLVFPHIDYCCLVYGDLSGELNLKIQRLVNAGIRYIYGVGSWDHISPHRLNLGWISARNRRKYFAASLLFKILNTGGPSYLARYFSRFVSSRPMRGDVPDLVIPRFSTETLRGSFHVSTANFWNSLPLSIRHATTLSAFKSHLYDLLLREEKLLAS